MKATVVRRISLIWTRPEDEIEQAIDLAWQDGHRNAAIIIPQSNDYQRLQQAFANSWAGRGGQLSFSIDNSVVTMTTLMLLSV